MSRRLLVLVLSAVSLSASALGPGTVRPLAVDLGGRKLAVAPLPGAERVVRDADGSLVFASGRMARLEARTDEGVMRLVERLGPALALAQPRAELRVVSRTTDALGMTHVQLARTHEGVDVLESDLWLHVDREDRLVSMNGRYPATFARTLATGRLADARLTASARRAVTGRKGIAREQRPAELERLRDVVWLAPVRRAAEVLVGFAPHQRWRVYVDVASGKILGIRDLVQTDAPVTGSGTDSYGRRRSLRLTRFDEQGVHGTVDSSIDADTFIATYNAQYSTEGSGTIFQSGTTTIADPAAVDVHANMRVVYDYFRTKHGRDSFDGRGGTIDSLVHYGASFDNAFWSGELMGFGDGGGGTFTKLTRCIDVAAHEYSHAVIQHTANLVYQSQSGALNEHVADVFGALVDADDWRMGEDCMAASSGADALRDLQDPTLFDQPGHMSQYRELPNTEEGDYGGVHINSGIPNRVAFLVGSRLGREALGQLWYRALTAGHLNQRSQFADLRRAVLSACTELQRGDCADVGSAFDAVGLVDANGGGGGGGCPEHAYAQDGYCYCEAGYAVNADGSGCVAQQSVSCPPNSTQHGSDCYCDPGFVPSADGSGCVSERSGACPAHSHREGGDCVCDDGYQGHPGSEQGCEPLTVQCPPNSRPADATTCECLAGWVVNAARDGCEPGTSGCGDETFFGRCVGDTLVYCGQDRIVVYDCTADGFACAFQDVEMGNNCLPPVNECADLPAEGACDGATARWCSDGHLETTECGEAGCGWQGDTFGFFCNVCPANALPTLDQDGAAVCACVAGFVPNEDLSACVENQSGSGGDDEDPLAGCGCQSSPGGFAMFALATLFLRRRRGVAALVAGGLLACSTKPERPDERDATTSTQPVTADAPEAVAPAPRVLEGPAPEPAPVGTTGTATFEGERFTMKKDESRTLASGVTLTLVAIDFSNSACPPGAQCVWAGRRSTATFRITDAAGTRELVAAQGVLRSDPALRLRVESITPAEVVVVVGAPAQP